ncbi:MAG: prepilin-type N-terminal cleavage/methylation domain-containing protein [Desulfovibrionales bacterium]|nr:prepilin-type N-terminal cleavage/methylation domain-containing protein [Desulfovibrionales bacterium]
MPEQRNQSGLTIVELLVGMVILGIVVTGLYNLFRVHNLMAAKQEETTRMQQELLSVIVQMADDIRMCGYTPNGGSFGFNSTSTDATSIFCTSDTNRNGIVDANSTDREQFAYRLSGNIIEVFEEEEGSWNSTARDIDGLTLTYFNADGTAFVPTATTIDTIRFVEINATATAAAERSSLNIPNRTMSTRVFCRNMGL